MEHSSVFVKGRDVNWEGNWGWFTVKSMIFFNRLDWVLNQWLSFICKNNLFLTANKQINFFTSCEVTR